MLEYKRPLKKGRKIQHIKGTRKSRSDIRSICSIACVCVYTHTQVGCFFIAFNIIHHEFQNVNTAYHFKCRYLVCDISRNFCMVFVVCDNILEIEMFKLGLKQCIRILERMSQIRPVQAAHTL